MLSIKKLAALLCLAVAVTGCATTSGPTQYGNYLKDQPASVEHQIATDALKQLAELYPPAKTHLAFKHPTTDAFGSELVSGLRSAGYALQEYSVKAPAKQEQQETGLPTRYILDLAKEEKLYRLTIHIGDQAMNRPYRYENGTIVPAGYWAYKE